MNLGPYELVEKVGSVACGELCSARMQDDGAPVLLKVLARENAEDERRLRHEFGLLHALATDELLHPHALHEEGRHLALVCDPFAGERLEDVLAREARLPVADALKIARRLARALGALHGAGTVHRDLRPINVLVSPDRERACLADASRAGARTVNGVEAGRLIDGVDWAYVSPEQTGRVDRPVDHRTDLYALGVLLHRMLAGRLPFYARDAAQWAHAHLALAPPSVSSIRDDIPAPVSDVVQRLLAKAPEDRYQSAAGLAADLERCLSEWLQHGAIEPFVLGADDVADELRMPQRLFGREPELATLKAAFDSAIGTGVTAMVSVSGPPGIGKSTLVEELRAPTAQWHGHFVSGKFDQHKRDIPYATLAQACDGLVRQVLSGSDAEIEAWRRRLGAALHPNAALLTAWMPHLEIVLGRQPAVPELPPQDAQRRFRQVLRRFIGACAAERHPVVLFLDDLQWADAETLALLVDLSIDADVHHLLLAAAWREAGIDLSHPLALALDAIRRAGGDVRTITLAPLALADVARLVGESLQRPGEQVLPLAQLVLQKTGGNPFFTRQFLAALADERLLSHDTSGGWHWDLQRIQSKGYTDNVVDLIVRKLARLPPDTQDALKRFACLGNRAEAATFVLAFGARAPGIHARLLPAVRMGLLWRQGETYGFLHDRVQEAAYSLIPEDGREAVHLQIGRALAAALTTTSPPGQILEAANQLNRGSRLVTSREERTLIAEVDLRAGRCARAASAFASALAYFVAGTALVPADGWTRTPELAFALELGRAECEFLTAASAQAQERLAALSRLAPTVVDRAAVACVRADLYTTLDQSGQALAVGLEYLRELGIDWPPHPDDDDVRTEYDRLEALLDDRPVEALLDLPPMTDPAALATLDVLTRMGPPAYFTEPNLYALVVCRAVMLSLAHGNGDSSSDAYVRLGLIVGDRFGDYLTGYRLGEVGIGLVDRGLHRSRARTWMLFAAHLAPTRRPVREGRDLLRRAFEVARLEGDAMFAGCIRFNLDENLLAAGDPLADVQREAEIGLEFAQPMQFGFVTDIILSDLGLVRSLRGLTHALGSFDDDQIDERAMEAQFRANPNLKMAEARWWVRKTQALFLCGDFHGAAQAAERTLESRAIGQLLFIAAEFHFYRALALAACCDDADPGVRASHLEAIVAHAAELDTRARHCPGNFADRAALVRAELARLNGNDLRAQAEYERAIEAAGVNGFVQMQAIAFELAAKFYRGRGQLRLALQALREAAACHARWGADAKVAQLRALHPEAFEPVVRAGPASAPLERTLAGGAPLDLLSLAKASQAISGELELDDLASALLRIVLENAGAQAGFLLLARGETLTLAAEARLERASVQVHCPPEAMPFDARLPIAVLNYVRRCHEAVVVQDAAADHPFAADPILAARPPRSLLCLPILRQSSLVGLLYLENHLVAHAFSPQRLAVLEVLTAQAAISLENARLYDDLKRENRERKRAEEILREQQSRVRRLVESNIIGVFFWDAAGGITEANEAFLRMTGYTQDDLARGGLRWTQLTPEEHQPADTRALEVLHSTGVSGAYEKEYVRKDGTRLPVLVGGALFEGSHDQGVGFVLDLSERRQAQVDREARRVAEAANVAKSQFLANMSHELRTPLNGILGFAQILLQRGGLVDRDRQAVTIIKRSGDHLLNLINDILDFAKIEAGRLDLSPVDVHLRTLLASTVELVRELAERKHVGLVWEPPADLPETVRADPKRLSQVLLNLLSNAVKFTDEGRVVLEVRWTPPGHLRFEVRDTGIGIAPEQCETLFRPFVQVGDVQRRSGGTGLGLAIGQQLVRRMGGEIAVRSQVGEGSAFSFELNLPVVQAAPVAIMPLVSRTIRGYRGPRRRILIVDDVSDNRALLSTALVALGFETAEATNGRECLEIAPQFIPDLLVMDLVMPRMAGVEAMGRLRRLPQFSDVPVIIVSASASAGDAASSLEAGADAFLPKPLDLDALLQHVGRMLQLTWDT